MSDMNTVTIPAKAFEELVRDSERLELFMNLIVGSISLGYDGKYMRIDDDKVFDAIRLVDEAALVQKERYLREKRRKEEEDEE